MSVRAGHYYQGRLGARFWHRLRQVGLLRRPLRYEDDTALAEGIGFTDIVKKPTASAKELTRPDYVHGRKILREKLHRHRPELLVFTFKKAAIVLCGPFDGHGFTGVEVDGIEAFVLPGPYERADRVAAGLAELRGRLT